MKILILENDPRELALIQQTLDGNRHTLIPITSSEQAWGPVQTGEARFLIANWDTSDMKQAQFIFRVRAARLPTPLCLLLSTSEAADDDRAPLRAGVGRHRPFAAQELTSSV